MYRYDKIILGAGIYGLYSALKCGRAGQTVLLLERDDTLFSRATYINQARVHMGYHYPRSLSTALKSAHYYQRFHDDFGFSINNHFNQIYATSAAFSWTNAEAFKAFCRVANISCREIPTSQYFNHRLCDGAFITEEDTYDAKVLREYFAQELQRLHNITIRLNTRIDTITRTNDEVILEYHVGNTRFSSSSAFLLNATYASTNQILNMIKDEGDTPGAFDTFKIKYEQCEIVLCDVNDKLKGVGLTVMDGPFFSIMPFGKTGLHSLTSVSFTPHVTSYDDLPSFQCQKGTDCSPRQLDNCNDCKHRPTSAWEQMSHLARKYMKPELEFSYKESLFSIKPILKISEIDDSRPTAIVINSTQPRIISVLSGKINTVYDLDKFLEDSTC